MRRWIGDGIAVLMMLGSVRVEMPAVAQNDGGAGEIGGSSKQMVRLEREAAKGLPEKQLELAQHYLTGEGTPKDVARAALWYEKAAKAGNPLAENTMGYLTGMGLGVSKDAERSLQWYRLAASGGVPDAWLNIGLAYLMRDRNEERSGDCGGILSAGVGERRWPGSGIPGGDGVSGHRAEQGCGCGGAVVQTRGCDARSCLSV